MCHHIEDAPELDVEEHEASLVDRDGEELEEGASEEEREALAA